MQPYPYSPWGQQQQQQPQQVPGWIPPQPPPPSRTPWLALVALLFVIIFAMGLIGGLGFYLVTKARAKTAATWSDADSPVPVTSFDPMWGDRTAPVTLVVFGDFEDPFCAKLAPTLDSLKSLYGAAQLRIIWKNHALAYHSSARAAAEAAEGVRDLGGNDAFWHFEERAFANQKSLTTSNFEDWARESAVDMPKFRKGIRARQWQVKIDDDDRLATTIGLAAIPTSYVNGLKVEGVQTLSAWQTLIDDELVKARVMAASGTPADHLYVERSKASFGTTSPLATATATATATSTSTYTPPSSTIVHRVPLGSSPSLGARDALVTIVIFSDFQCPFCSRAAPTIAGLRMKYGSDLRTVWKNNPLSFHIRAMPAAELALEARDERGDMTFWAVHDVLFTSQVTPGLDDASLMKIARDHGVNETRAMSAITMHLHKVSIDDDIALAKKLGATGTPTFFINGRELTGAQPSAKFEAIIDEELINAKDRVTKGTPRAKVYDVIMSESVDPP